METRSPFGRVVIAGGSGFLGVSLAHHLAALGADVVVLSRRSAGPSKALASGSIRTEMWDARSLGGAGAWPSLIDGSSALINLTGRTVDCIKSPDHCDEILRSRVESTRVLGEAVRGATRPPPVWVQMSTAHIYGDPPEAVCDETSAFGFGLAPTVGRAWEEAFDAACPPGVRRVVLRTSFVVGRSNEGGSGALGRLGTLARFGLGGTVGSGRQGMSWLHELDMNRLFERAICDHSMLGAFIATAPNPVSNKEFMRALRRAIGVPIGLPAPGFAVKVAAPLLLGTDPELALFGRYCVSRRLLEIGFEFRYPQIDGALRDIYRREP